jgi:pimeloyl-ACP methyl ester carboxylesterase
MSYTPQAGNLTLLPYVFRTDSPYLPSDQRTYREPAELGRLRVPENRRKPDSRLIELAFVRFPSTARHPAPPLIYLAGGPGGEGIGIARAGGTMFRWFMELREIGDVILLDQRGTGMSQPALHSPYCWNIPPDQPGSRESYAEIARERSHATIAFWQERAVDLSGYTTVESADDVDAVRTALGAPTMHLYGASYGSHLTLATIRRHHARIARAVIPLVEGPDHTVKLPSNTQKQLERLTARVQADSHLRTLIPDFLALVRDILDRLAAAPVTVTVTDPQTNEPVAVTVGKFDLQLWTASSLGSRPHLRALPARYYAMTQGDFSALALDTLRFRRSWFGNAMTFQMDCASGATAARQEQIAREARDTLLEDLIDFPFPDVCDAWGSPDLGDDFRAPVRADLPTLFIAGTLDGRTPVSNAEEVMAGFPNSNLIVVDGGTHSSVDLAATPAVNTAIQDFFSGKPVTTTRATIPFSFEGINA